jgi:hypothetical protein
MRFRRRTSSDPRPLDDVDIDQNGLANHQRLADLAGYQLR